jgi:hypothetical protein
VAHADSVSFSLSLWQAEAVAEAVLAASPGAAARGALIAAVRAALAEGDDDDGPSAALLLDILSWLPFSGTSLSLSLCPLSLSVCHFEGSCS